MQRAVSVVTDPLDERCLKSLADVRNQCTFDPTAASAHHHDYAAALATTARSIHAAFVESTNSSAMGIGSYDLETLAHLKAVLSTVCATAHVVSKLPLDSTRDPAGCRHALRREMALLGVLLNLIPTSPPDVIVTLRLTAKSIARARAQCIAADPQACTPLLDWTRAVLFSLAAVDDDVAIAMLTLDRLGRSPDAVLTTPIALIDAAKRWLESEAARASGDDGALARMQADDFLRRHERRMSELDAWRAQYAPTADAAGSNGGARTGGSGVPVVPALVGVPASLATPRRPAPPTPRPGTVSRPNPRPDVFEDRVSAGEMVRQLLDGHGWCQGDLLSAEDTFNVLRAAKEYLEEEAYAASCKVAEATKRLEDAQLEIEARYAEIRALESSTGELQLAGSSESEFELDGLLKRMERTLRRTSAATPRL